MSMLTDPDRDTDPDTRPTLGQELRHRSKGYLAILVALAVLVGGGYLVYAKGRDVVAGIGAVPDYPGPGGAAVTVAIPDGTSVTGIGEILVKQDVIKSTKAWSKAVAAEPSATSIQAGSYSMHKQM